MLAIARVCEDNGPTWLSHRLMDTMDDVGEALLPYSAEHGRNSLASKRVVKELAQAGQECLRVWPDAGHPSQFQQVCFDSGRHVVGSPVLRVETYVCFNTADVWRYHRTLLGRNLYA